MPIKTTDLAPLVKEINASKNRDAVYSILNRVGFDTGQKLARLKKEYRGKNMAALNLLLAAEDKIKVFERQD